MATKRATTPRPAALARLAGSPARAAAVEAVLAARPDDAEPDDGDKIVARQWAEDAVAAEAIDRAEIRRDASAAILAGDLGGALRKLSHLPSRELASLAEWLRLGQRRSSA